ncbi:MAG: ABC transporter permease [Promethearchaeota archaeon]
MIKVSDLNIIESKLNLEAVWILARREVYEFWRNKTRLISSLVQGVLFLFVFSAALTTTSSTIVINGINVDPRAYAASGISAIVILFTGIFGGMGVMRDKMFGFMKELIVAPVSRRTLMLGKTLGVALQTLTQVFIIVILGLIFGYYGYDFSIIWKILLILPVALLASVGIVGMGLTISTRMRDFQSFGLIQTFIVMPMFLISGAFYTLSGPIGLVSMFNPFTYSVDLFRVVLVGASFFPIWLDLLVVIAFGTVLILLGARSFSTMEVS